MSMPRKMPRSPARQEARNFWQSQYMLRVQPTDSVPLAGCTGHMVDQARATMEAEAKAISDILSMVRRRRNKLLPVSRLPSEVLSMIFEALSIIDPPRQTPRLGSSGSLVLRWIRVSFVCWSWRKVALDNAGLWTDIVMSLPLEWKMEMLDRSKAMPFSLSAHVDEFTTLGSRNGPELLAIEKATSLVNLPRLVALELDAYTMVDMQAALVKLDTPAPLLERLEIRTTFPIDTFVIPDGIFASTTPRLRKLALKRCIPASWDAAYLRNLTYLELTHAMDVKVIAPTALLGILRRSPRLEKLIVNYFLSAQSRSAPGGLVSLPHLTHIFVRSSIEALIMLFEGLSIPTDTTIEVGFHRTHDDFPRLVAALSRSRSGNTWSPFRRLSLDCEKDRRGRSIHVHAWAADYSDVSRMPPPTLAIEYSDHQNRPWPDVVKEFCKVVHLREVISLSFAGNELHILSQEVLQAILVRMPAVQQVVLRGKPAAHVAAVLAIVPHGDCTLLLPGLEVVEVVDATFGKRGKASLGARLVVMAQMRREFGCGIKELRMEHCSEQDNWVEALQDNVGYLIQL